MHVIGRCLTVWIKDLLKFLPVLEMVDMRQIKDLIYDQAHLIKTFQSQSNQPFEGRVVEIDVKEMFPSIPKSKLIQALKWLFNKWVEAKRRKSRQHWYFSIHRLFNTMDCMGQHNTSQYRVLTWNQVLSYTKWDLYHNVFFHHTSKLLKRRNGVPIGGPCQHNWPLSTVWHVSAFISIIPPTNPYGLGQLNASGTISSFLFYTIFLYQKS